MSDILIVTTSNVCRGPMLEVMLKERLRRVSPAVTVASRGINVVAPSRANAQMAQLLKSELNADVSGHIARQLSAGDMGAAQTVLTISGEHRRYLAAVYPEHAGKTRLVSEAAGVDEALGDDITIYKACLDALGRMLDALDLAAVAGAR